MISFFMVVAMLLSSTIISRAGDQKVTVTVEYLTGEQYENALALIGRVEIADGNIIIRDVDGNILSSDKYEDVKVVRFKSEKVEDPEPGPEPDPEYVNPEPDALDDVLTFGLKVYPNPTTEIINVEGLLGDTKLNLFNLKGQRVKSTEGTQINVSDMENGIYLLQVGKTVVRVVKR